MNSTEQLSKRLNTAMFYCITIMCVVFILFIAICSAVVPGMLPRWQRESPAAPTDTMQFMIDASYMGRCRWYIWYPQFVGGAIIGVVGARKLARK